MTSLPSPRHLIGIDGGGTGTRAVLSSPEGRVHGRGEAGPSALAQGAVQSWQNIRVAVAQAFADAGLGAADDAALAPCAIGLGLAGAENPLWVREFHDLAPGFAAIVLDSDGYAALLGAHAGAPGALVAVGTGSIGVVLRADGTRHTVGGWGWKLGDEAGGGWFGQHAVRHTQQAMDGRVPGGMAGSPLAQAVAARCGADRATLLDWTFAADQRAYAALAPLVAECEASDPAAAALITLALDEVQRMADALDPRAELPLALTGSIGRLLKPRLALKLRHRLADPAGDATEGALHLLRCHLAGATR